MKRQKNMTLKNELSGSVGAQYATGEEWKNSPRKNKQTEPKKNVTDVGRKIWCYEGQHCIGTWNLRSMNQGSLEAVK